MKNLLTQGLISNSAVKMQRAVVSDLKYRFLDQASVCSTLGSTSSGTRALGLQKSPRFFLQLK